MRWKIHFNFKSFPSWRTFTACTTTTLSRRCKPFFPPFVLLDFLSRTRQSLFILFSSLRSRRHRSLRVRLLGGFFSCFDVNFSFRKFYAFSSVLRKETEFVYFDGNRPFFGMSDYYMKVKFPNITNFYILLLGKHFYPFP